MDNDFLKNLDSSQVREMVDSMYPREFDKGSYVIREGDIGTVRALIPVIDSSPGKERRQRNFSIV